MEFQVKLTGNAKREIETAYLWLKQRGEEVDQVDVLEQNKR